MPKIHGIVEEVVSPKDKKIPLNQQDYAKLERAMQWPEDLPAYDKLNKTTNLTEIGI